MTQTKTLWIKNPLGIFSPDTDASAGLLKNDTQIVELIPSGEKPRQAFDEIFDTSEHVILPGLINTHHHFYQTLTRAYSNAINKPLFPWLAHGIHFDDVEMKRLADAGVGVCHCASSNMILSSGICPVHGLENAGVSVGIGVDGSASNDCSNMIPEVRMAFLLQRLVSGAQTVTHIDAIRWATQGST